MPIHPLKVARRTLTVCMNKIARRFAARSPNPSPSPVGYAALRAGLALALAAGYLACASPEGPVRPSPSATPEQEWEVGYTVGLPLPDMPHVTGALAPRVVYPVRNALVAARDSNFIFGSTGSGDATLTINGAPVDVHPNGAFLAWLPLPAGAVYQLVVTRGDERAVLEHPVRLTPVRPSLSLDAPLAVDTASVTPDSGLALRPDELVRVAVRATADARVALETASGVRHALQRSRPHAAGGALFSADLPAGALARGATLLLQRNNEQLSLRLAPVEQVDTAAPTYMRLGPDTPEDLDRVMVARPLPGGTYRWLLLPGTPVRVTGWNGAFSRVRLDTSLEAWVNSTDLEPLPHDAIPPRRVVSNMRVVPYEEWVDVIFPMSERPAFLVQEDGRTITVTLYDVVANTDIITHSRSDTLVRHITWEQETSDRARYTLQLAHEPFGYVTFWEEGRFVLRVRRRPEVNERNPLRGMRIAVDAGHPPAGSTGPTGLTEAEATLAVAIRLQELLEARGATVVMTRTTPAPVALTDRPAMARQADAHALVSIHANALPDGVNPFPAHGTGTYYFHPHSDALARHVQAGMTGRLGLRDLGVYYDNLALVRPTWMPAILCEGAFMMIPEQEAALRTPEFQERYARGVADGLESWFRSLPVAP